MIEIWQGILATGGRKAEPFDAKIVVGEDGELHVLRTQGVNVEEVAPPMIRGDSWLAALTDVTAPAACLLNVSALGTPSAAQAASMKIRGRNRTLRTWGLL